jgi:Arc/MetJ-type ribon-helix-helix transcriptional regulator
VKWEKMDGKNLVEMQIPVEEVENIDELVSEGYYGSRSAAIRDIIRRGVTYLRLYIELQKENGRLMDDKKWSGYRRSAKKTERG